MARPSRVTAGTVHGMLTVVSEAERVNGRRRVLCRCECGVEKIFDPRDIAKRTTASCGCNKNSAISARMRARVVPREPQDLGWGLYLVPLTRGRECLVDASSLMATINLGRGIPRKFLGRYETPEAAAAAYAAAAPIYHGEFARTA